MLKSIQDIYQRHHLKSREDGFSILETERGVLLKSLVGQNKNILDIGCRDGALTKYFTDGNKVLGVDIDNNALIKIKNKLGIDTDLLDLNGDWLEINKMFDVVVAGEILEHLYYPEEVVTKVKNKLNINGLFLGSVPNAFSLKNRLRYLRGQKKYTPLADPTHINHFSYVELKNILEKHFKNVKIIGLGRYARLSKLFPGVFAFDLFFIAHN